MIPRFTVIALRSSLRTTTTTNIKAKITRRNFQTAQPLKMAAIVDTVKKTVAENFGVDAYVPSSHLDVVELSLATP